MSSSLKSLDSLRLDHNLGTVVAVGVAFEGYGNAAQKRKFATFELNGTLSSYALTSDIQFNHAVQSLLKILPCDENPNPAERADLTYADLNAP